MFQISIRCIQVLVRLEIRCPDYITSGNCKAEGQISALIKASVNHQPAPPAFQP